MMKVMIYVSACALLVTAFPAQDRMIPEDIVVAERLWNTDSNSDALQPQPTGMIDQDKTGGWSQSEHADDKPTGELNVLHNLVGLKAYCLAAHDNARFMANQNSGKYGAIVQLIASYGEHQGDDANIVSEYADLVAAMKQRYGNGINSYVLDNLDHNIRTDPNGVVFSKIMTRLRYKSLGLTGRPAVLHELAAKTGSYQQFQKTVAEKADNADTVAATAFFKSKAAGRYKSFLQREIAKVHRRMKQEFQFTAKSAYVAEKTAFEEAYEKDRKAFFQHVRVQAKAGLSAAEKSAKELPWKPPTLDEMKAIAAKQREQFMKSFKAKHEDLGKVIKEIVGEVNGVKLFITTGRETDAQSTMKPEVTFIGKKKSVKGRVRAVPGKGNTFVQHFKVEGEPLKDLKQVVLTAPPGDQKWSCAHAKVRVGGKDGKIISLVTSESKAVAGPAFWLAGGKQVTLVPDKAELGRNEYEKAQCMGWKATQECDGKGKRDGQNDRGCTDEIDSGKSGYCQCDSGRLATVDCGHDTFTCKEICMT